MASRSNARCPGFTIPNYLKADLQSALHWLLLGCALLVSAVAGAQTFPLQIQVSVVPPYSAYLQDYAGAGQQVRIVIINTSQTTYQVRLTGQLTGDNGVDIRTSANYRPLRPLTVPPGQKLLTRADLEGLFDLNQIEVAGIDKSRLAQGLPLPDGFYQLCVRAYNEGRSATGATLFGQPLSAEFPIGCSAPIQVRAVEPPILVAPLCDAEVMPVNPQALVFTWTPPVGVSPAQVEYTLRVVELPQVNIDPNVFIDAVALPRSGVEVRNLRTGTFLYGPTQPPLTPGKRYAWRVQAIDRSKKLNFLNDGKSPVCVFTYGSGPLGNLKPGMEVAQTPIIPIPGLGGTTSQPEGKTAVAYKSNPIDATCSCKYTVADKTVNNKPALEAGKATVAGFQVTFLKTADGVKEVNGVLTGNATIPMPLVNNAYFKLRVELVNVQCNAAGEVISGYIQAIRSGDFPGIFPKASKPALEPPKMPEISTANADSVGSQIQKLSDQMKAFPGHMLSQAGEVAKSVGMEVPFGIDKQIGPVSSNIAITDVFFTPEDAYLNATTFIESPGLSAQFNGIPLAAYHLCIKPDGTCGDKILYLAKDMAASSLLTLKGGAVAFKSLQERVTYVVFDGDGFKSMHIAAGLKPPGLHRADDGTDLELLITSTVDTPDFNNWSADVTFDDFYVSSLKDYVFSMTDANGNVTKGTYDNSENDNPTGFPADYTNMGNLWKGIYFPLLQLKLGGVFAKLNKQGKPLTGGVQKLVYDNQNGFSGKIFLQNILTLGDGQLKSWGISVDEITGTFVNSEFKEANMRGGIGLPLFKKDDGTPSLLSYSATIANNPNSTDLTFNVKPSDNMHVDVWRADLKLNSDSHIDIKYVGGNFSAKANFNGKLDVDISIAKITACSFEELAVMTDAPYFSLKNLSFNSPQRYLGAEGEGGFPLTLTNVGLLEPVSPKNLKNGQIAKDLGFTGNLDLADGFTLKGSTTARLRFTVGAKWEDWGYNDFLIDKINVDGKIGPVGVNANIDFVRDDPKWGNGFYGDATLNIGFASGLKVQARFGRTTGAQGYKYYFVSGVVPLLTPIALGTSGLFLKAFRGGLYKNVNQVVDSQKGTVTLNPNPKALGLQAGVIIGTPIKGSLLNMDGTLTVEFNPMQITIDAAAYLLHSNEPPTYTNPLATGKALININITESTFSGDLNLKAQQSLADFSVVGSVPGSIYLNWSNGDFYAALGNPNGARVDLSLMAGGAELFKMNSYFLMGTYVPKEVFGTLPPPPYGIPADMLQRLHYKPSEVFAGSKNGAALAFGAFTGVGTLDKPIENSFGPFVFEYSIGMGYDFVLKQVGPCAQYSTPGFNGWYAVAQLYAYLGFALSIDVDLWFYEGRIEALSGQAAALLQAGMVNPIWLQGSVMLRYRALGGLVRGSCSAHVEYNIKNQCIPKELPIDPFGDLPLISSLLPDGDKDASIMSPFYAEFNFPVETNIDVDSTDKAGHVLKTLTFRIVYKAGMQFLAKPKSFGGNYNAFKECINDDSGRLRYGKNEDGDDNYNATFYRNSALAPETDYTLKLGLVAIRREPGGVFKEFRTKDGKVKETVMEVSFRTGKCNTTLTREGNNKTIAYSYPFEGQRYFMKGENKPTFIEFMAKTCCIDNLDNTADFNLKVRLTPGFGGSFNTNTKAGAILLDAKFVDKLHVTYDMSQAVLKNNQLYRFELVRVPTQKYIKEQEAILADMKKKSAAKNFYVATGWMTSNGQGQGNNNNAVITANVGAGQLFDLNNQGQGGSGGGAAKGVLTGNLGQPGAGAGQLAASVNLKATAAVGTYLDKKPEIYGDGTSVVQVDLSKTGKSNKLVRLYDFQQDYEIGKKLEQVLYTYYFQTSKFNTLSEKLAMVAFNSLQEEKVIPLPAYTSTLADNMYVIPMGTSENFDTYELRSTDLGNGKFLPSLIGLKADWNSNAWFKDFVNPTLSMINYFNYLPSGNQVSAVWSATDRLSRQMVYTNSMFEGPEPPIKDMDVDKALMGSEAYYETNQITGEDVMIAAGTAAQVMSQGKRRVGVVLDPTPFHKLYANTLVKNAADLLIDLKEKLQPLSIDYATAIDKQLKLVCTNMGMTQEQIKTFTDAMFVSMTNATFYDNMKVDDFDAFTPAIEKATVNAMAYNKFWPPVNFTFTIKSNCYIAYLVTKIKGDTKMNENFFYKSLSNISPSGFKNPEDFYYKPLRYQKNSSVSVQVWTLPATKVANYSLNNPAGVSDRYWDKEGNCLSPEAFSDMLNTNRTGLFFIKFK
nr:hypothetical protein [uncultured Arsenicibacter sp.]